MSDPIDTDDFREFQDGGLDDIRDGITQRGKRVRAAPSAPEPERRERVAVWLFDLTFPGRRWDECHEQVRQAWRTKADECIALTPPPAPAVPSDAALARVWWEAYGAAIIARDHERNTVSAYDSLPNSEREAMATAVRAVLARLDGRDATP